jgi:hypothetical protein
MKIGESVTPENLDPVTLAVAYKVHLLYEPGYVTSCVGKLTEETSL